MILDEVLEEIKKADKICILAHDCPDGDAIGSTLGMYHILKSLGKNAEILLRNIPANFAFLPEIDCIKSETDTEKFDLAISLDCSELKRINSDFIKYFEEADVRIEFDHHINNAMFADYNVVNHVAPACCQILVASFDYLGIDIPKEAMVCWLTGIITDTGGFKNSGTSVETFEIVERAIEMGLNLPKVYKESMLTISRAKFELEKIAMSRMEFLCDGKVTYTYITKEDMQKAGAKDGDHEGIVEIGRNIDGVEVSIMIREDEKGYKISLRSNDYVEVSQVGMLFGGGGHIRAAGAISHVSLEETKKMLVKEIEKRLK